MSCACSFRLSKRENVLLLRELLKYYAPKYGIITMKNVYGTSHVILHFMFNIMSNFGTFSGGCFHIIWIDTK